MRKNPQRRTQWTFICSEASQTRSSRESPRKVLGSLRERFRNTRQSQAVFPRKSPELLGSPKPCPHKEVFGSLRTSSKLCGSLRKSQTVSSRTSPRKSSKLLGSPQPCPLDKSSKSGQCPLRDSCLVMISILRNTAWDCRVLPRSSEDIRKLPKTFPRGHGLGLPKSSEEFRGLLRVSPKRTRFGTFGDFQKVQRTSEDFPERTRFGTFETLPKTLL